MLKSEDDYQLTDFSKTTWFNSENALRSSLAITVHMHTLTNYPRDGRICENNPSHAQ